MALPEGRMKELQITGPPAVLSHEVSVPADLYRRPICVVYPEGTGIATSRRRTRNGLSRNT